MRIEQHLMTLPGQNVQKIKEIWSHPMALNQCQTFLNNHPDIKSVEKVTHIAPADEQGNIIGAPLEQFGVINYATTKLSLCIGFTHAPYSTTTEVYPDSPKVTDEDCINAQVASITGGLDYIIENT